MNPHLLISSLVILHTSTNSFELCSQDYPDVLHHYTEFPYPPVSVEKENISEPPFISGPSIGEINHYIHGGKLRIEREYRILVVGGGTGNSSLHYAYEFRKFNVEIVHLDISEASLEIARQRADKRGSKIRFIHNSLYNIPKLNLGKFDYIDCVGVFHHLSDVDLALRIFKDSLKDESSGLYLSLHTKEGRKGINLMRKLLHLVNEEEVDQSLQEELEIGKMLWESLPEYHWIFFPFKHKTKILDDVSFCNKYIHKHTTSFSVNEASELIEKNGSLHLINFADPDARIVLSQSPRNDPEFDEVMSDRTLYQKHEIHERMYSALSELNIFISKDPKSSASLNDPANCVPYFYNIDPSPIFTVLSKQECGIEGIPKFINVSMALNIGNWRDFFHPVTANTLTFYELIQLRKYTIDGILTEIGKKSAKVDFKKLKEELLSLLKVLLRHSIIVLRHSSTPDDSSFISQPRGVIEHVRIINFELPIYTSEWPRWIPSDAKLWSQRPA
ncbi:uncharacterized protein [Lepeophtheirus salmonis]|uniref:uncharacterized protein n=1 Tax=Lepeophtheirus salmonis TaxID=72036 RepID=UPI001AE7B688|nr:uncharacterized protein LOC121116445 [Lepeophtheirus salmonis]